MKEGTKNLLNNIGGWVLWNTFFLAFLLVFAGLVYVFLKFSQWVTQDASIEIQAFSVPVFGLAAVSLTIWLMFKFHEWINRRKS